MKAVILDGTPQEIGEALKAMDVKIESITATQQSNFKKDENEEVVGMPKIFARRVLNRISLAPSQKALLKAIYDAGEGGILGSELLDVLDYSQAQFRGMMGAFGRRVANTDGFSTDFETFFKWEWDSEASSYRYWLEGEIRAAVKEHLKF